MLAHIDKDFCELHLDDIVIDNYLNVYKVIEFKPILVTIRNINGDTFTVKPKNIRILKKADGTPSSWEEDIKKLK